MKRLTLIICLISSSQCWSPRGRGPQCLCCAEGDFRRRGQPRYLTSPTFDWLRGQLHGALRTSRGFSAPCSSSHPAASSYSSSRTATRRSAARSASTATPPPSPGAMSSRPTRRATRSRRSRAHSTCRRGRATITPHRRSEPRRLHQRHAVRLVEREDVPVAARAPGRLTAVLVFTGRGASSGRGPRLAGNDSDESLRTARRAALWPRGSKAGPPAFVLPETWRCPAPTVTARGPVLRAFLCCGLFTRFGRRRPASGGCRLDRCAYGPVQMLVVAFDGNRFRGEIWPELERLKREGVVRILDLLLVRKDSDGRHRSHGRERPRLGGGFSFRRDDGDACRLRERRLGRAPSAAQWREWPR